MGVSYWEVFEVLRRFGNSTTVDLKTYLGCGQNDINQILSELKSKGLIKEIGRAKSESGQSVRVWSLSKKTENFLVQNDCESFYDSEYAQRREARRIELFGEAGRYRRWD